MSNENSAVSNGRVDNVLEALQDLVDVTETKVSADDYATDETGGTVKVDPDTYCVGLDGNGKLKAMVADELDYSSLSDNIFISKGTLKKCIVDAYRLGELQRLLTSAMVYKGTVLTKEDLPTSSNSKVGDVYRVTAENCEYIYIEEAVLHTKKWTKLGIEGFSGDYNDLTNKPTIPTVPTNISEFNNDSGYVTNSYHDATKQNVSAKVTQQSPTSITLADNTEYNLTEVSALTMTITANIECHIFLTTASTGTPSFSFIGTSGYAGDSTDTIGNSEVWEFSVKNGYVIGKKWSVVND